MNKKEKTKIKAVKMDGKYILSVPDDFLNSKPHLAFIKDLFTIRRDDIVKEMSPVTDLLIIDLPVQPTEETRLYFTLSGIEEILYGLFNGFSGIYQDELEKSVNMVLYVTLKKSKYHTIPIMNIRLILEGRFEEHFVDKVTERVINDMPIYIGITGNVEYKRDISTSSSKNEIIPSTDTLDLLEVVKNEIGEHSSLINFLAVGLALIEPENLLRPDVPINHFDDIRELPIDDDRPYEVEMVSGDDIDDLPF